MRLHKRRSRHLLQGSHVHVVVIPAARQTYLLCKHTTDEGMETHIIFFIISAHLLVLNPRFNPMINSGKIKHPACLGFDDLDTNAGASEAILKWVGHGKSLTSSLSLCTHAGHLTLSWKVSPLTWIWKIYRWDWSPRPKFRRP